MHFSLPLLLLAVAVDATTARMREWNESANELKKLLRMLALEDGSQTESPLFALVADSQLEEPTERRIAVDLSAPSWRSSEAKRWNIGHRLPVKNNPKMAAKRASTSELRNAQSQDDLALLQFLLAAEEPTFQIQQPLEHDRRKTLSRAEKRYQQLTANRRQEAKRARRPLSLNARRYNDLNGKINDFMNQKALGAVFHDKRNGASAGSKEKKRPTGKWMDELDLKSARNKITMSVAFAVIVTALFCVVVQLFKIFGPGKTSGASATFDQINRRSGAYGYERIALDVDEHEDAPMKGSESQPLNLPTH